MKQVFNGQEYEVTPTHDSRQWYMEIGDTAGAYGVSDKAVFNHIQRHPEDLRQDVEFGAVTMCDSIGRQYQTTVLFREGVIKLGFFIRSPQAAAFRQFATDLIVQHLESQGVLTGAAFAAFVAEQNRQFQEIRQEVGHVGQIAGGLRLEVDQLKEQLGLFVDWDDQERREIQAEIEVTKKALDKAGTYVVGKVRAMLGVSGIYGRNNKIQVINCLRNMRGEGLKAVE